MIQSGKLYVENEVADILGISLKTVRMMIKEGRIPAELHNSKYFVDGEHLMKVGA